MSSSVAGGGQHQDAGLGPLAADRAADVVAVDARQVAIEHEHVVAHDPGLGQRLLPVGGEVDGDPVAPQAAGDRVGQAQLVLGDQHTHPLSMTAAP